MEPDLTEATGLFIGQRVLVLGDVIADVYLEGRIARISREAPVLILEHAGETLVLGGAGNAAANLRSLRGQPILVGITGDDGPGVAIKEMAASRGIDVSGLVTESGRTSCTKTRILATGEHTIKQQMLRVDRIPNGEPRPETVAAIGGFLARTIPTAGAAVISDYGLGIIPVSLYLDALRLAVDAGRPVIVDSRHRVMDFAGATILTPNAAEAEESLGTRFRDEADLVRAGWTLMDRLRPSGLLITRGPDGMSLFERGGAVTHIPAANRLEVFDVSGAGDTVVAGVALGLAAGLGLLPAARLANYAAGVAVRKMGTATVSLDELRAAIGRVADGDGQDP